MDKFRQFLRMLDVLPSDKRAKLSSYFSKSLIFSFLDLISIAYLTPVILMLVDPGRFHHILDKCNIDHRYFTDEIIKAAIFMLIIFSFIKNLLQIRFSNTLFNFLYELADDISVSCARAFINGSYLDFQKQDKGQIIQNVMRMATDFSCKLLHSVILLATEAIVFGVILAVLFYFYFYITLIAFIVLVVFSLIIYYVKRSQIKLINNTYHKSYAAANSKLINILDGYLEIKSSGNSDYFLEAFGLHNHSLNRVTSLLVSSSYNYSKYLEMCLVVCLGGLAYYTMISKHDDQILLISLLAAMSLKLIPSFSKILNSVTLIRSHFYTIETLTGINARSRIPSDGANLTFIRAIEFKSVSFGYLKNQYVLDDLNLEILRGTTVGITGVSGAGKTTLLNLIMGLIQPQKGAVLVDGVPLNQFPPFVSYVPQQPFLFSGTLIENIVMGARHKVDYAYIQYLCEHLHLKAVIDHLPNGLNTEINHNSLRFSGGQRQRLSLVRALYQKPKLLILDEATNQQNKELEQEIHLFIKQISRSSDMTVVAVSHGELSNGFCDRIYQLLDKKLVEVYEA